MGWVGAGVVRVAFSASVSLSTFSLTSASSADLFDLSSACSFDFSSSSSRASWDCISTRLVDSSCNIEWDEEETRNGCGRGEKGSEGLGWVENGMHGME